MAGRRLISEQESSQRWSGAELARRRAVLRETIAAFDQSDPPDRYHRLAKRNLDRWRAESDVPESGLRVDVLPGDWGEVTRTLTNTHGVCFAVLNLANAYVPGGAYVEGAVAQEENMFRRTDCHFRICEDQYDVQSDRYLPEMTRLLSGEDGVVYLDTQRPRVCIRGPEDRSRTDLGYPWLPADQVFPFFELRAAAQDLRDGSRSRDPPCCARCIRVRCLSQSGSPRRGDLSKGDSSANGRFFFSRVRNLLGRVRPGQLHAVRRGITPQVITQAALAGS